MTEEDFLEQWAPIPFDEAQQMIWILNRVPHVEPHEKETCMACKWESLKEKLMAEQENLL